MKSVSPWPVVGSHKGSGYRRLTAVQCFQDGNPDFSVLVWRSASDADACRRL